MARSWFFVCYIKLTINFLNKDQHSRYGWYNEDHCFCWIWNRWKFSKYLNRMKICVCIIQTGIQHRNRPHENTRINWMVYFFVLKCLDSSFWGILFKWNWIMIRIVLLLLFQKLCFSFHFLSVIFSIRIIETLWMNQIDTPIAFNSKVFDLLEILMKNIAVRFLLNEQRTSDCSSWYTLKC